jgi:hypothetical protein
VPAALAGALLSLTCVLSGAAAASDPRGTLLGALFAFIFALSLLAHSAFSLRHRAPTHPWRADAAAAAAAGTLLGVLPACTAAAQLLHARSFVPIMSALAAQNPDGVPLSRASFFANGASSSVHLLRDVRVRDDLMGEGFAFWPMCVVACARARLICVFCTRHLLTMRAPHRLSGVAASTPLASARRGATPSALVPMGTFCALPLVPIPSSDGRDAPATWQEGPPAWALCDNNWAGGASCAAAASRSYALAHADAHAPLAACLDALRPLFFSGGRENGNGKNVSVPLPPLLPALFFGAGFEPRWGGDVAAAAAPAVRRAALDGGMRSVTRDGYANVTLLRCAKRHVPVRMPRC